MAPSLTARNRSVSRSYTHIGCGFASNSNRYWSAVAFITCSLHANSRGNLFLRREVSTTFGAWKHLMRIAAAFGVEHLTQRTHGIQIVFRELLLHEINFLHADPVLAGDAAAEFDALLQNVMSRLQRAPNLTRVAFVVKDQRMNVAVTSVKYVRDAQAVLCARGTDELHHLREFRARHDAILREIVRAEPSDGAKCALAT